jgi:hypothetical protein
MNETSAGKTQTAGPHQAIAVSSEAERFTAELFDRLWSRYRERVEYVRRYEEVISQHQAQFVNDHIAFRTIAGQAPLTGIASLSRIFEALGYRAAGLYHFDDKALFAMHFQHANGEFPKLFISELQAWKLPKQAQDIIARTLASHQPPLPLATLNDLANVEQRDGDARRQLLASVVGAIEQLPWEAPVKQDVLQLNEYSQYGAWVLVHGYNVNHFTSLINSHRVEALNDIEKTAAALRAAGVPMKAEIEGAAGSKLRQTATNAVTINVPVRDPSGPAVMAWTYAYFELAERGEVDDGRGQRRRFEGFLGPQATQLFEMTRK